MMQNIQTSQPSLNFDPLTSGTAGGDASSPFSQIVSSQPDRISSFFGANGGTQNLPYGNSSPYSGGLQQGGMSGIAAQLAAMMANLSSMLGSLFGGGTATGGTPASAPGCGGAASQPCPSPQSDPSQFFQNATASSQGDPHDAFNGTTSTGAQVGGQWNNQSGHGQLLSSDSFRGGYDVSTSAGASNANGTTLNQSASVTTNGGANSVTMRGDGSFNVESNGSPVSLQPGQSVSLSPNETVTLNGNDSLSVLDRNTQGGSINTTLRANTDGGVDVSTNAHNIDLGGYLANHGTPNNQQPLNEFRNPAPRAD